MSYVGSKDKIIAIGKKIKILFNLTQTNGKVEYNGVMGGGL